MRLNVTPQDMKASKIVKPGWHILEITENVTKPNKEGDAMNVEFSFVGAEGDAKDVPFKYWLSEKAPGFSIQLLTALGFKLSETEANTIDIKDGQFKGRKVKAKIEIGMYNNRKQNQISEFAPAA